MLFTELQREVVRACAAECERQQSGERSVARLIGAYNLAHSMAHSIHSLTKSYLLDLGAMVEPEINHDGFRRIQASFSNGNVALPPALIDRQIDLLIDAWLHVNISVIDFVHRFLEIHPFKDGNGRVAFVLYNHLMHRCDNNPIALPEFQF